MNKRVLSSITSLLLLINIYGCSNRSSSSRGEEVYANGENKLYFSNGEIELYYPASYTSNSTGDFIFRAEYSEKKEYVNCILVYKISGNENSEEYINNYIDLNVDRNPNGCEIGELKQSNTYIKAFYAKMHSNEKGSNSYFSTVIFETAAENDDHYVLSIVMYNEFFSKEISDEIIASFKVTNGLSR